MRHPLLQYLMRTCHVAVIRGFRTNTSREPQRLLPRGMCSWGDRGCIQKLVNRCICNVSGGKCHGGAVGGARQPSLEDGILTTFLFCYLNASTHGRVTMTQWVRVYPITGTWVQISSIHLKKKKSQAWVWVSVTPAPEGRHRAPEISGQPA